MEQSYFDKKRTKILIIGAGAVGGFFGSRLIQAGCNVSFVARGDHGLAIKKHGLKVSSFSFGEYAVSPPVYESVMEAHLATGSSFSILFVTVKAMQLIKVAEELASLKDKIFNDDSVIISLLNGVESGTVLSNYINKDILIGGLAHVGAQIIDHGFIKHTTRGEILVAPLPGNNAAKAKNTWQFLESTGLNGGYHDDLLFISWRKLVWNNGFNALTALTNLTMGECASDENLKEIARNCMRETVAIALAEGINLPESIIETMLELGKNYGAGRTSMNQDVMAGKQTEHDAINGVVCRLGKKHGIPTPYNDSLFAILEGRNISIKTQRA